VRVGLPPAIVPCLRSAVSYIITLMAPTGDHEVTSCPQMVFIGSGGTSAWGMTLNRGLKREIIIRMLEIWTEPRSGRSQAVKRQVMSGHNRTQPDQTSRPQQVHRPTAAGTFTRSRKVWHLVVGVLVETDLIAGRAAWWVGVSSARCMNRLYFRLIRVRSRASAYYRVGAGMEQLIR
jgi:hypothetical protein